ncbi:hypothetical protein Tco_0330797 [Tanacetum coccineum]
MKPQPNKPHISLRFSAVEAKRPTPSENAANSTSPQQQQTAMWDLSMYALCLHYRADVQHMLYNCYFYVQRCGTYRCDEQFELDKAKVVKESLACLKIRWGSKRMKLDEVQRKIDDTENGSGSGVESAPMTQAAIRRMIKDSIDTAIAVERARQANVKNDASRSGPVIGAVELRRWFEKTESVFEISECAEGKKVKFAAATLEGPALT